MRDMSVSIHLMFLLIRLQGARVVSRRTVSIHLMFLLIKMPYKQHRQWTVVSIHLMFLLIKDSKTGLKLLKRFNTSHVSINPVVLMG